MRVLIARSSAGRLAPALLLATLGLCLTRLDWLGEPRWGASWIAGMDVIVGPLIAGLAAYDVARWSNPGLRSLLRSTARGRWALVSAAVPNAAVGIGVLAIAQALALLAAPLVGARTPPPLGELAAFVALQSLSVLACAGLGGLLAALWPSVLAAPVAAVAAYGIVLLPAALGERLFVTGASMSVVGSELDPSAVATVLATATALALLSGAVLVAVASGRRREQSVGLAATGLAVIAAAALAVPTPTVWQGSSRPVELVCAGERPRVCLAADAPRGLDAIAAAVQRMATPLHAAGADVPATFQIEVPGRSAPSDRGLIQLDSAPSLRDPEPEPRVIAQSLATPAQCFDLDSAPPPYAYVRATSVLVAWLLVGSQERSAASYEGTAVGAWLASPEAAQQAWVRTTYAQLRACDLAAVRPPA